MRGYAKSATLHTSAYVSIRHTYRGYAKSATLALRVRPGKTLLLDRYLHTSAYVSIRQHTSVKRHLSAEVAAEQDVVAREILVHNRIGRLGVEEVHADRDVKEYLDYLQYSFCLFKGLIKWYGSGLVLGLIH